MKKLYLFIHSVVLITALIFASGANAGGHTHQRGQVQFQFQIQFQSNGFNNHGHRPQHGYWHKDKYGHNHFHYYKPAPKPVAYYKLTSKKSFKRLLKRRGYRRVHNIKRTRHYYEATAVNRKGHKVWVRFSRKTGRRVHQKILVWHAYR